MQQHPVRQVFRFLRVVLDQLGSRPPSKDAEQPVAAVAGMLAGPGGSTPETWSRRSGVPVITAVSSAPASTILLEPTTRTSIADCLEKSARRGISQRAVNTAR
jgi:hypothetical protein